MIAGAGAAAVAAAAGYGAHRLGESPGHPPASVSLLGAPGSFGGLSAPGPQPVETVAVAGWGFGPGQSAYMSAVAADGTVFVATTPFSDDQSMPTGIDMELGVFDPAREIFTRLVVPSSRGRLSQPRADPRYRGIGGGDVSDVVVVPGPGGSAAGGGERVMFCSATPYYGWDTAAYGTLPTIGQLAGGGLEPWRYDPGASWDTDALAATLPPARAALAFPVRPSGGPRFSRGPAALARLPRSGHVVVLQYFGTGTAIGDPAAAPAAPGDTGDGGGTDQGALFVIDTSGKVRAFWQYPPVSALGQPVVVNPREVVADPTSVAGDERFVVVLDARAADGQVVPFPIQEFAYSSTSGTVTPRGTAVRAAQDGTRMETACFGADGTLYVARTAADGLRAAALAVYRKNGSERAIVSRAPAWPGWQVNSWGATCPPDRLVAGTARGGLVRSIVRDPVTEAILLAGLDGQLQAVRPSGRGPATTFAVSRPVDLGLDRLRGPSVHYVGLRRGCVDARRRVLWLPANQLILGDLTWPYPPFKLDQWLYRIELDRVLS